MNQQGIDISETRNILCFLCLELLEFWDYELHAIIELVFYSMLSHCGHCGPGPTRVVSKQIKFKVVVVLKGRHFYSDFTKKISFFHHTIKNAQIQNLRSISLFVKKLWTF